MKSEDLKNQGQYRWFKTFDNPCYGFDVKMDVSEVVKCSKEKNLFLLMCYILLQLP